MYSPPWKSAPDLTGTAIGTWVVVRDLAHDVDHRLGRKVAVRCQLCSASLVTTARRVRDGIQPCGCAL